MPPIASMDPNRCGSAGLRPEIRPPPPAGRRGPRGRPAR